MMLNKDFLLYLPVGTRILRHTNCRKLLCEMLSISTAVWLSIMPSGISLLILCLSTMTKGHQLGPQLVFQYEVQVVLACF